MEVQHTHPEKFLTGFDGRGCDGEIIYKEYSNPERLLDMIFEGPFICLVDEFMEGNEFWDPVEYDSYEEWLELNDYDDMSDLILSADDIKNIPCNGVQREHNKKLNNGLPILHKVPPKRDYGRYFCIMAEKGGTSHGGLTEKLSPFFHAKKQEVNAYGR